MDDLIRRQDAIDALQEKVFHNLSDEFYGTMQVLNELPSAQQWIPCSKRLPDQEGEYLVTFNDEWRGPKVRTIWYGTPFDIIIDRDKWVFYCDQEYGFEIFAPGKPVVAWMRMPDPYNDGHE